MACGDRVRKCYEQSELHFLTWGEWKNIIYNIHDNLIDGGRENGRKTNARSRT